ncbi:bacteriocin [Lentzea tibetensis]|uniref:Bacteriocin n=1 Tax=Lentzea tibetensis TaxID=2591470 RepID=A0A563EFG1_9PSEU|nr:bacteriocin [Lentzea tibetensis]TWP43570.1 bacteriocin [Lentzea tibetensis]
MSEMNTRVEKRELTESELAEIAGGYRGSSGA